MLLSGIYYGKTRIGRAYKNGEIIWRIGTDKYIDDVGVDIKSDVVAYVTAGALKILQLEEGIQIYHNAFVNTSMTKYGGAIIELVLCVANSKLSVDSSSAASIETATDMEHSSVVHISPTDGGDIDLDASIQSISSLNVNNSASGVVDEAVNLNIIAKSQINRAHKGLADENLAFQTETEVNCSSGDNGLLRETMMLKANSALNVNHSENGVINEAVTLNIVAEPFINRSHNALVDNNVVMQIETDLTCSASDNGLIREVLSFEKDSILNVSNSGNSVTNEDVILNAIAEPLVNKSCNSLITNNITMPIDTDLSCSPGGEGIIEDTLTFEKESVLNVSDSENGIINETANFNVVAVPFIGETCNTLTDNVVVQTDTDLNRSSSNHSLIRETLSLDKDVILQVANGANSLAHESTILNVIAESSTDRARNGLVEHNIGFQIETDLNCSLSDDEWVKEALVLEEDSVLNVSDSVHSMVDGVVTLKMFADPLIDASRNGLVANDIIVQTETDLNCLLGNNELAREMLLLEEDSILNVDNGVNGIVDNNINLNVVAEPLVEKSDNGLVEDKVVMPMAMELNCSLGNNNLIRETSVLGKDAILNVDNGANSSTNETVVLNVITKPFVGKAHNGLVDENVILQIETDLNYSSSNNELVREMLLFEKDSVLNVTKSINGNIEHIVTLRNETYGNILASVTSVINALSLIDPDVNCRIAAALRGIVNNELSLQIDSLGAMSHVESGVIDNEMLFNDTIETQISKSVQSLVDQAVSEELLAQANISVPNIRALDNATVLDTGKNTVSVTNIANMKTYNMCLRFENNNFIQVSETDGIYGEQTVSLLCEESEINISDKKLLSSCGVDVQATPIINIRFGTIFEALLSENSHMTSNNDLNVALPLGLMITHMTQSGFDAFLSYSMPYDADVMQSIQSSGISIVTFWKPLELCLNDIVQDNCLAKLDYQNTIAAKLDGNYAFKSDVYLTVDAHGNLVEFNMGEKITSSACLFFWQLPVQQENNLLIRQVWETEPYFGDGPLIIY